MALRSTSGIVVEEVLMERVSEPTDEVEESRSPGVVGRLEMRNSAVVDEVVVVVAVVAGATVVGAIGPAVEDEDEAVAVEAAAVSVVVVVDSLVVDCEYLSHEM